MTLRIVSRSEWGARAPKGSVVHVPWANRIGTAFHYSQGNPNSTPRDLQNYAMDNLGYTDTHYNFFVDRHGTAYEGRGWTVKAAHARDQNIPWIGICFIGRDADVTTAALNTMRAMWDEGNRLAGRALRYGGHGQLPGQSTSCPGSRILNWIARGIPGEENDVALNEEQITMPREDLMTGEKLPLPEVPSLPADQAIGWGLHHGFAGRRASEEALKILRSQTNQPPIQVNPDDLAAALVARPGFMDGLAAAFAREMAKITWRGTPS